MIFARATLALLWTVIGLSSAFAKPSSGAYDVPVGASPVRGPSDALVTIVEFGDFECRFSNDARATVQSIEKRYQGRVRFVFKHLPGKLEVHKNSELAAQYAAAAHLQGKFWELHDLLFANQKDLDSDALRRWAEEADLDLVRLQAVIDSGEAKKVVEADRKLGRDLGVWGTPSFFVNGLIVAGAQPFVNFQAVIDAALKDAIELEELGVAKNEIYKRTVAGGKTKLDPQPGRRKVSPDRRRKIDLVERSPKKGGKQPLVTLVVFADFECPFCGRLKPILDRILRKYGQKVQVRFRHNPLTTHKRALPAARAAVAAHLQGKFWPMHDKLLANRRELDDKSLTRYARQIGLNTKRFKKDIGSKRVSDIIETDRRSAEAYGARGTPTVFVNGVRIDGALPFEEFTKVIDKEIKLAQKRKAGKSVESDKPKGPKAGGPGER